MLEKQLNMSVRELLGVMQNRIINASTYFGIQTWKNPLDFWIYQEIIWETYPNVIIEIGNHRGGTTLALAHMCDAMGHGEVIGIDISHKNIASIVREHPRIRLIEGDACSIADSINIDGLTAMVIEDSSHTFDNTLAVLNAYSRFVTPGNYFIVEDSICHHGLDVGPSPGPYEAIESFISSNDKFTIDRSRESFLITWNPTGFLKRIK